MTARTLQWTAGLVASVAIHAGAGALLLAAMAPDPVEEQPTPTSELDVQAYALDRTRAQEAQPEPTAAAQKKAEGAALDQGAIPQTRARPLTAAPGETLQAAADISQQLDASTAPSAPVPAAAAKPETLSARQETAAPLAESSPETVALAEAAPATAALAAASPALTQAAPQSAEVAVTAPSQPAIVTAALNAPESAVVGPALARADTAATAAPEVEAMPAQTPDTAPVNAAFAVPEAVASVSAPAGQGLAQVTPAVARLAPEQDAPERAEAARVQPARVQQATANSASVQAAQAASAPVAAVAAAPAVAEPQTPSLTGLPETAPTAQAAAAARAEAADVSASPPKSERMKATLAFPGAGGDIDPVSLAAFQSFMEPGDARAEGDALRDGVAALFAQVPCSRLQVAFDPDTATLNVNGHVPADGLRAPVLAALQAQMGSDIAISDNVLILPRPQCGALSGIADVGLPQSTDQITNPLLIGEDTHARVFDFVKDQRLTFDITAPEYPAYVYVDYFDAGGNVLHLAPNDQVELTEAAADSALRIGSRDADEPGLQIFIGPPYGQEIAVAFAASEPLYDGLRPIIEPAAPYLEWLKERVADARAQNPDFKGEWVYFFISTRAE